MKKNFFVPVFVYLSLAILVGCKKGDTGPVGPVGPAGPTGPAGPAGTANVNYSDWFTPGSYVKDTVFGIWGFTYDKAVPAITQPIIDSGVVLTYGKLLGYNPLVWPAGLVQQLPITLTYNSGGTAVDTWSARITPGNLQIRFVNDRNIYTSIATAHQFRYIIIPGAVPGARIAQRSYQDICREYNIPE